MSLKVNVNSPLPMSQQDVSEYISQGTCPCALAITGACKPGSLRDCTVQSNVANVWFVAWTMLSAGDLTLNFDDDFIADVLPKAG